MPKISQNTFKLYHKEVTIDFNIEIHYNSENGFFIKLPPEYIISHSHLNNEQCEKFNTCIIFKNNRERYREDGKGIPIVKGQYEGICLENFKLLINHLLTSTITKREVIIVFYNPKDNTGYNSHKHNVEHPQIGLQFGLTYATETRVGENLPKYYIYSKNGESVSINHMHESKREINLWNSSSTIIDDTPENREFLETMYKALINLNEKMKEFTKTPEALLSLISSNQKLLN